MKKFHVFTPLILNCLFIMFAVFIQSCNTEQSEKSNGTAMNGEGFEEHHTSQNSLDYQGVYIGILPCDDCEGVETTIALGVDNVFLKKERFIGKNENRVQEITGEYFWHTSGQVITLEGLNTGHQFFVGENYISQLDSEGKRRTGALEDKYRLNKELY